MLLSLNMMQIADVFMLRILEQNIITIFLCIIFIFYVLFIRIKTSSSSRTRHPLSN